jgi:hypothetical protein
LKLLKVINAYAAPATVSEVEFCDIPLSKVFVKKIAWEGAKHEDLIASIIHKPGDRPRNFSLMLRRASEYRGVTVIKSYATFISVYFYRTFVPHVP